MIIQIMKSIIITVIFSLTFLTINAQNTKLHITGGNVNVSNSGSTVIILNNTKFIKLTLIMKIALYVFVCVFVCVCDACVWF